MNLTSRNPPSPHLELRGGYGKSHKSRRFRCGVTPVTPRCPTFLKDVRECPRAGLPRLCAIVPLLEIGGYGGLRFRKAQKYVAGAVTPGGYVLGLRGITSLACLLFGPRHTPFGPFGLARAGARSAHRQTDPTLFEGQPFGSRATYSVPVSQPARPGGIRGVAKASLRNAPPFVSERSPAIVRPWPRS